MKAAGFVVHPARETAMAAAKRLSQWFDDRDIEVRWFDPAIGDDRMAAEFAGGLQLILSVGGDGTFLRAAHVASAAGCPILGVKVGRMGFLTEVEPEEAPPLLELVATGGARIEERLAVLARPESDDFAPQWALNEVIVEKRARHRLVRLALYVGDIYVTTLSADGVIVATPTGSTAYSFSAGGPIVTPAIPCLLVTPVAPHMVFDRTLVIGAEDRVNLEVVGDEPGLISADGRESLELPIGSRVRIGTAPNPARLVRRHDAPAFHALVRQKFGLPDGER
ncbi:MAG TPA: NAD(+)/NADH kinase [Actinomycetota bacterium]|nr:NAD(+)/NADH kinase [Actinomycetota bacterium]